MQKKCTYMYVNMGHQSFCEIFLSVLKKSQLLQV